MFGYVNVNEPELKIREFDLYRSYYCGMCMDLKENYGQTGRMTLSYDTAFLSLLLTSLYEPEDAVRMIRCAVHPLSKHLTRRNEFTRYASDINIMLTYYSCLDDWADEKDVKKKLLAGVLKPGSDKACALHPEKAAAVRDQLEALHKLEREASEGKSADSPAVLLDRAGGIFGELMAEIFDFRKDQWSSALRRIGFSLGKFIYILDAYDDMEKDRKNGSFNPLLSLTGMPDLDGYVRGVLTMAVSDCAAAFETLPVVENIDILRNILYSGIWRKFDEKFRKRTEDTGPSPDPARKDRTT